MTLSWLEMYGAVGYFGKLIPDGDFCPWFRLATTSEDQRCCVNKELIVIIQFTHLLKALISDPKIFFNSCAGLDLTLPNLLLCSWFHYLPHNTIMLWTLIELIVKTTFRWLLLLTDACLSKVPPATSSLDLVLTLDTALTLHWPCLEIGLILPWSCLILVVVLTIYWPHKSITIEKLQEISQHQQS